MAPKFSANLGFLWPDLPLLDRIGAASKAGFRAVELHWPYAIPPQALKASCAECGVRLLGVNSPPGHEGLFGLGAQGGREDEFRRTFDSTASYARIAGASAIHVMAGVVAPEERKAAQDVFLRNLAYAAAAAPDFTLLLEPMNPRDRPSYFYSRIGEAAEIIRQAQAPNLRIMFDVYHVGATEGDVLMRLERHLPQIGHIQ